MKEKLSYTEAFDELQLIVAEMENGEISVDVLSEKVKRASLLIQICKQKLKATELDVQKILKELDGNEEIQEDSTVEL
ncbi:MAG: exodeoxyribonuclease VII small subunit [Bacteroidetes bacterium HGW-Bacteroidetes-1]|jgi:exodeoxyribonuclease VII small subunit|nr:MAG: exodeoxyribonuclease VII small subunit [Bacteroidetes bacterium HGW-Bacteroidetes-1]